MHRAAAAAAGSSPVRVRFNGWFRSQMQQDQQIQQHEQMQHEQQSKQKTEMVKYT